MSSLQVLTGRDYVSYSGLTSYLDCGERFRLERVLNHKGQPGYWLAGGTAVHSATEWYDETVARLGTATEHVDKAVQVFHDKFDHEVRKHDSWKTAGRKSREWPNGEDAAWWKATGPAMVLNYVQWRAANPQYSLMTMPGTDKPGIEVETEFTLPGDIKVKAIIDRVFVNNHGEALIVDLKTGSRKPPSSLQLGLYATALEQQYGFRPQIGAYWMGRSGELTELSVLDRYNSALIGRWMRDFRKAVELQVFIPHVTAMCSGCSVNDQCYAYNPFAEAPDFLSDINQTSHN